MSTKSGLPHLPSTVRYAHRVKEFCERVGISRSHFYELVKQDKIRTIPDSERARLLGEVA